MGDVKVACVTGQCSTEPFMHCARSLIRHSRSETLVRYVVGKYGPKPRDNGSALMEIACSEDALIGQRERQQYMEIWTPTFELWRSERSKIPEGNNGSDTRTWQAVNDKVRKSWLDDVRQRRLRPDSFALWLYRSLKGGPASWDICFDELVHVFAQHSSCSASVISIPRNGKAYTLRPSHTAGQSGGQAFGPPPQSVELSRGGKILRNLGQMHGPADGGNLSAVPRELHQYKEVPVDEVLFTHSDVSDHFKDGRPIWSCVDELERERINPLDVKFLELDVVRAGSSPRLWSLRNRRLYCLKEYQQRLRKGGRQVQLHVKVCLLPLEDFNVLSKFIERFSTQNGGLSVEVRRSSKHHMQRNDSGSSGMPC